MPQNLRLPGPTPVPPAVRRAMDREMVNHRGPEFAALVHDLNRRLPALHKTSQANILFFAASGTGGLEASLVNLFSPGDTVISASIGYFGDRSIKIARAYGLNVIVCDFAWGTAADPGIIAAALRAHPEARAVMTTHNETATGVTNDIAAIGQVCHEAGRLFICDAVSSMVALPLYMDDWHCDVVISGSQKAWMCPPGLALVAVGPRAWEAYATARLPRYYWDFAAARDAQAQGVTPATPALSVMFGLQAAVDMIEAEGLEEVWARHARIGALVRRRVAELGLVVFGDPRHVSDTVTAVELPASLSPAEVLTRLRVDHDVVMQSGQGDLANRMIRIGHLGWVHEPEINEALDALASVLNGMGHRPASGSPALAISAD